MNENAFAEELIEYERKRNLVLGYSLTLENVANKMLAGVLNIRATDSISLGTSSSGLSFNNKINLLIDLGAMEKVHLKKFLLFMSIRNKFLHLLSVQSFKQCFDIIDGSYNQLNRNYPPEAKDESEYEQQYVKLANDVFEIAFSIRDKVRAKLAKVGESQSAKTIIEVLQDSLPTTIQNLESIIAADPVDKEKLKSILESLKSYKKIASII